MVINICILSLDLKLRNYKVLCIFVFFKLSRVVDVYLSDNNLDIFDFSGLDWF